MSAERSARTIRQADGLDPVRALQRVLYRSAKQDRTRKFHALYDKLVRNDVMQRAWKDVAANQGAPGIDKVSITDISSGGPESIQAFLDVLIAELRTGTYRPKPLRRVHIPKPGKPGQTRALGIPVVGEPRDNDRRETGFRAYLRGGLLAGQLWVSPKALRATSPGSGPNFGQPGIAVGARRRHQGMLRRDRP